jgi:hypothetical protein
MVCNEREPCLPTHTFAAKRNFSRDGYPTKARTAFFRSRAGGRFLNRVQVENLEVVNLIGLNLFTSSLELAKFST